MTLRRLLILPLLLISLALRAQTMSDGEFAQKFQLARIYEESRDMQNAVRLYEELYRSYPTHEGVAEGYIRVLYALKRFIDAEKTITDVIKNNPSDEFGLDLLLAKTRSQLGHKADALAAFNDALHSAGSDVYSKTIAITSSMIEIGYDEEALDFLKKQSEAQNARDLYLTQMGSLLFKLGRYDEGTADYLEMLRASDQYLSHIQGLLSQFTADTTVRRTIIQKVLSHIDTSTATIAELRLAGWCYGELRDYDHSLDTYLEIESKSANQNSGQELYFFAQKALAEGAYDAAARAYRISWERAHASGNSRGPQPLYYEAEFGMLRSTRAMLAASKTPQDSAWKALIESYRSFAAENPPNDLVLSALGAAGEVAFRQLHDPKTAESFYEDVLKRSHSFSDHTSSAYFSLEEIALATADLPRASKRLDDLETALDRRTRAGDDGEIRRHVLLERARIDYFSGSFDTALAKLTTVANVSTSDYANDAISLQSFITENRESASDASMKVFAKAELYGLGSDLNSAISGYRSIIESYPKTAIADEATLRTADLMTLLGKYNDAVALLQEMQERSPDSPVLDKAAMREADITEHKLLQKDKALKLYEDFLARFPKSPLCTEARQRARKLRGDVF